ncbi:MAG: recombination mediator RecR [Spirochaetota bacterium]|nr:recombination mediator RecR [Spirochaetota bacterium]
MNTHSVYLDSLIREFYKLPGIGPKSASRLAFHILKIPFDEAEKLAKAIIELKNNITFCKICGGIADEKICSICLDEDRDRGVICVVEEAKDVLTIEKTKEYRGLYHVLRGVISPLNGIGPEELNINSFIERCRDSSTKEVIIATNPTIEGDATGLYLARILRPIGIKVMRIAHGLPVGADIEFADNATIAKSIAGRIEI